MRSRRRKAVRILVAAGAASCVVTVAAERTARADALDALIHLYVSPGVIWSGGGVGNVSGWGGEISAGYTNMKDSWALVHVGAFYRGQHYDSDFGSFGRRSYGLEGGLLFFGVEVGGASRDGFANYASTDGLHFAAYASIGIFYVGPQWFFPSGGSGSEYQFNVGFKLPLPQVILPFALAGLGNLAHPSGRALRVRGRPRYARTRSATSWLAGVRAAAPGGANREAATRWTREAMGEHASIGAFAKLARELMAIGAPLSLVRRAHEAALDEIRHARDCFTVAQRLGGEALGPGPLRTREKPRKPTLLRIARESLLDGCIGEGVAAELAARAASRTKSASLERTLRRIAEDEARHAELAWDIVEALVRRGGVRTRGALSRALEAFHARWTSSGALDERGSITAVVIATASERLDHMGDPCCLARRAG